MLPVEIDISKWRWPIPKRDDQLIATDRKNHSNESSTKSVEQNREDAA